LLFPNKYMALADTFWDIWVKFKVSKLSKGVSWLMSTNCERMLVNV
jgi:hypothetical protein